ncbi:MAG: flagellar protein FhlB [Gammaproteobacteria bacterium TMED1]|jgi:flagellar biosynthesis protein|nr:MAG: flagellar protein FhlB [Gammaproteobacteria bacterium TMED1]|tara:strand:+ start:5505 stop:5801 length:297 start_codon:yes stop_codon:yes gene_type:complete
MLDEESRVAVALLYDKIRSPKVIAKGRDSLAESIVAIAEAAEVPITEDHLLAETLAKLELNAEIPESLFRSVAVILAWVYRLQGKTPWDNDEGTSSDS